MRRSDTKKPEFRGDDPADKGGGKKNAAYDVGGVTALMNFVNVQQLIKPVMSARKRDILLNVA